MRIFAKQWVSGFLGKLGIVTSQIHSDWLEVLTDTSFWGLIPFVAAFIACWWIVIRSYGDCSLAPDEREWLPEIAGLLGMVTVRSFFNIEMSWHAPLLYLTIIAYTEFLRRKRIEHACHLVSTSNIALAEIAMTCGFSDQSHFSATFRRQVGLTPARFRQMAQAR